MKKFFVLILILMLTACAPASIPAEATNTAAATQVSTVTTVAQATRTLVVATVTKSVSTATPPIATATANPTRTTVSTDRTVEPTATLVPTLAATTTDTPMSKLVWSTTAPLSVSLGGEPFQIKVYATNSSAVDLPFDVSIELLTAPTDGTAVRSVSCGSSDLKNDGVKSIFSWTGVVPANSSCEFEIYTKPGKIAGTFQFVTVTGSNFVLISMINVFAPELPEPRGVLGLLNPDFTALTAAVKPGDMVFLQADFYFPAPSQFEVGQYESTCPLYGLPSGPISGTNVTDFHYGYFLNVPGNWDEPSVVGVPVPVLTKTCQLTADFWYIDHPEKVFTAVGSYKMQIQAP